MKIYTEEISSCWDCPNRKLGYGAPYCTLDWRSIQDPHEIPEHCLLPDKEEQL